MRLKQPLPPLNNNKVPLKEFKQKAKPSTLSSAYENFSGIWVPLITPFANGEIDIRALQILVMEMIDSGIHGLVVCGTTGEAASLSRKQY